MYGQSFESHPLIISLLCLVAPPTTKAVVLTKKRAAEATRQYEKANLGIRFLMTLGTLRRSLLALGVLGLVAVDARSGRGSRIVERGLRLGLHRGSCGRGVAVLAILVVGLQRLFRLRSMMAGVALCHPGMGLVIELHAAHGSALQNHSSGSGFRRIRDDRQDQHKS